MEQGEGTVPQIVAEAYDKFFELGYEAQDVALPLIEEATITRGRNFPEGRFSTEAERVAAKRRWGEYLTSLGDKLAQTMDPLYSPGHGGNMEGTIVLRSTFLKILENQTAKTLLQTKELIDLNIGK